MARPPSSNHDLDKVDWFHGNVSRAQAEALVVADGDFLVRESQSQPGSYVLTCRVAGQVNRLHFVINTFKNVIDGKTETLYGFEGERYPTVQRLISMHIVERKPITDASQALIMKPVTRGTVSPLAATQSTPVTRSTSDYAVSNGRTTTGGSKFGPKRSAGLFSSTHKLGARSTEVSKSSVPHVAIQIRNRELYDDGGDYSDYDEIKRAPSKPPLNTGQGPTLEYDTPAAKPKNITEFIKPQIPRKYIDAASYKSEILQDSNKPLDPECMYILKEALFQNHHRLIAQHITYLDLHMLRVTERQNLGAGVFSGLEAFTLPQGAHFRQAAIERHCSLSFLVAVTILACTDITAERVQTLKTWVLIAAELQRHHGNVFSFMAVMEGLTGRPIGRLGETWLLLEHTEPVVFNIWKTKLTHTYKELKFAGSDLPLDHTCIPNILPICQLLENENSGDSDLDLEVTLAHLDTARLVSSNVEEYCKKGKSILQFFKPKTELRDLCRVEVHMRLLYGHKGSQAKRYERQAKFAQILNILSMKAEPQ